MADISGPDTPNALSALVARPLSKDDVPAWLELEQAVEQVDRTGHHVDAEDLAEELADPKLDTESDTLGLWDGTRLVAFATVHTPHGAVDAARFDGGAAVHPDWRRRGLGAGLVDWMGGRATALHTEHEELAGLPGELMIGGKAKDDSLRILAEHRGFTPVRWWFEMTHPLRSDRPEPRPAPDGTRIVPFDDSYDEATRLAHNDAFRDHWNFTALDPTDWHTWVTGARSFRPAMSRLLVAGDEVGAYLLAEENEADTAASGKRDCHVGYLATRRDYRGRGAAPALLADALQGALDAGYDTASLTVDTVNPSGALGLYEKSGFVVDREFVTYARPLTV